MNKLVLFIMLMLMPTIANAQEVIAEMDKAGLSTLNEELRQSAAVIRNNKALVSTIQTTVNALEDEFSVTDGHTHDGVDSKQISYNNLLDVPVLSDKQIFTVSGTFTAPDNISYVFVSMVGGGGGSGNYGGGGGGAGSYIINAGAVVTPGNSYTVTVGSGGSAGAYNTNGGNGKASSFIGDNITITCNGGSGNVEQTGGVGGLPISGEATIPGSSGGLGGKVTTLAGDNGANGDGIRGGGGAGGYFGVGGNGGNYSPCSSGTSGYGYGSGAGGPGNGCNGSNGRNGIVIIEW